MHYEVDAVGGDCSMAASRLLDEISTNIEFRHLGISLLWRLGGTGSQCQSNHAMA